MFQVGIAIATIAMMAGIGGAVLFAPFFMQETDYLHRAGHRGRGLFSMSKFVGSLFLIRGGLTLLLVF